MNDEHEDTKEGILNSPADRPETLQTEPSDSAQKTNGSIFGSQKLLESVTPFGQRKSKFVVQFALNEQSATEATNIKQEQDHENSEDDIIKRVQPSKRCSIVTNGSQPEPGCRFMYDRIEDKVIQVFMDSKCA